jgi:hypothetical protein
LRSGPREGVEVVCPFCRVPLYRPKDLRLSATEIVQGGVCKGCGAVYLMDDTGKNVGEIMMQGLSMAADRLGKDLIEMVAGEDYEEIVLNYDWRTHRSSGAVKNYLDRSGKLYVIKVNKRQ